MTQRPQSATGSLLSRLLLLVLLIVPVAGVFAGPPQVTSFQANCVAPCLDPATIRLGATVSVSAPATLAKVEFFRAGETVPLASFTSTAPNYNWTQVPPGSYPMSVVVTDSLGQEARATASPLTVRHTPRIRVLSPTAGSTVAKGAPTPLSAMVSDPDAIGIDNVVFKNAAGSWIGGASTPSNGAYTTSYTFQSLGAASVTAIAYNRLGTHASSAAVHLQVAAVAAPPPAPGPLAYISNSGGNSFSVIDTGADALRATVPTGLGPKGLAVSPDARRVYVALSGANSLAVYDAETLTLLDTLALPYRPLGVAVSPDGARAYVSVDAADHLLVIDTASMSLTARVPVGTQPQGLAVSSDGARVFVANGTGASVSVIDAATLGSATWALPAGSQAAAVAVKRDGSRVYVTGRNSNAVYVLDGANGQLLQTLAVGTQPFGLALDPEEATLYVANFTGSGAGTIAWVDLASGALTPTALPAGAYPLGLGVHPEGSRVYAAGHSTGRVYVLDAATGAISKTLSVGSNPYALGIGLPQTNLVLVQPAPGALLNQATPALQFAYQTRCQGLPCQLAANYNPGYRLLGLINGLPFESSASAGQATWQTANPLPEGRNEFSAWLTDRYGGSSNTVSASFTIDTLAPSFTTISPPSGSVLFRPNTNLAGSVDEAGATITLGGAAPQAGPNFSFPLTLNSGLNTQSLVATDPAANSTTAVVNLTYAAFALTLSAPEDHATVSTATVTVRGSFSNATSASVTVNGIAASISAQEFSAEVSLLVGQNTLTITATRGDDGQVATRSLTVTRSEPVLTPPNLSSVHVGPAASGASTVTGFAGAVAGPLEVEIANQRTGQVVEVGAKADGSFIGTIGAMAGDTLRLVAVDQNHQHSAAVEAIVPADPSNPNNLVFAEGFVTGTVLDAGTGAPIEGVQVKVRGPNTQVLTDAQGRFTLPIPGASNFALFFKKTGFIETRRDTYVRPGGDATVGEVAMHAGATELTVISAATGGTFTDPTGNVQVIIPPGALEHDASFGATFLPTAETFPLPLPRNFLYTGGVQMAPEHHIFKQPVRVRVKNNLNLPAGTPITYFFASHDEDDPNEGFYDPGTGAVTADGQFVEFEVMHFSCMAPGFPGPAAPPRPKEDGPPDYCGKGCSGSSRVGYAHGDLSLEHKLLPLQAFGRNDAPSLVYDSLVADFRLTISNDLTVPDFLPDQVPERLEFGITMEGSGTRVHTGVPSEKAKLGVSWPKANARGLPLGTGTYPYLLEASSVISASSALAAYLASYSSSPSADRAAAELRKGAFAKVDSATNGVATSSFTVGQVIVNDRSDSAFGAGWNLAELARIHRNADGSLLLTEGAGAAAHFLPRTTEALAAATDLPGAFGVAAGSDGAVYVTSGADGKITRIGADRSRTVIASGIPYPKGITLAPDGTIYFVDGTRRLQEIRPGGEPRELTRLSGDHFDDIAVSPQDGKIYVLDGGLGRVWRVNPKTGISEQFYRGVQPGRLSILTNPMSLAFDAAGNLYVTSNYNLPGQVSCGRSFVVKFDRVGNASYFRVGLNLPRGIAVDASGDVYVADYDCTGTGRYDVWRFTPAGDSVVAEFTGDGLVFGLAFDLAIQQGKLLVTRPTPNNDLLDLGPVRLDAFTATRFEATHRDLSHILREGSGSFTQVRRDGSRRHFDPNGLLLSTTEPQGLRWDYQYDDAGRLLRRTNAAGQTWSFDYLEGKLSQITDPAGRATRFTIDGQNNLIQVVEPGGSTMNYEYDSAHKVVAKSDHRDARTQYEYGPEGNVILAAQNNGERRRFKSGRKSTLLTPAQAQSSSAANPLTLPTGALLEDTYTNANGFTTRYQTNRYGAVETEIDALGATKRSEYNRDNQVLKSVDAQGADTVYTYDTRKRLSSVTGPQGLTTWYTYDALDRLTRLESNDLWSGHRLYVELTYDARSNIARVWRGRNGDMVVNSTHNAFGQTLTSEIGGSTTHFSYDEAGRLLASTDPLSRETRFTYDAAGNRTEVRDNAGLVTRFEYDAAGRLIRQTDPAGHLTQYAWEAACATCGRATQLLTSLTDPMGRTTQFEYDLLGQLTREVNGAGESTTYAYDDNRNLATMTRPDGTAVAMSYDALDRLVRKDLPDESITYGYDSTGNLTGAQNPASTLSFSYDSAKRLIGFGASGAHQAGATFTQEYDGAGSFRQRLTGAVGDGAVRHRMVPTTLGRPGLVGVENAAGFGLTYDNRGRMTQIGLSARSYDDASQLLQIENYLPYSQHNDFLDYAYDPRGQRVSKRQSNGGRTVSAAVNVATVRNQGTLAASGAAAGGVAQIAVNGQVLGLNAGQVSGEVVLRPGVNSLEVVATDALGAVLARSAPISVIRSDVVEATLDTEHVQNVSTLAVTGTLAGNALAVRINGQAMSVSEGRVTGSVALAPEYNFLEVQTFDAAGLPLATANASVFNATASATRYQIKRILALAPNGDAYVIAFDPASAGAVTFDPILRPAKAARRLKSAEGVAALLPAGASALQFPDWLADAEQIAVDTANVVYLLRSDASLWRHDAGGDTQLADLSAQGTLLSLVPGSANKLLFTVANDTQVREADGTTGSVQTVLTLPPAGEAYLLASSAWGVIALGRDGKVYHLEGATATEIFTATFGDPWGLTLALAPEGTVCWINASGEGACRAVDATQVYLGGEVFPSALAFDTAGRFYSNGNNNADNLYRGDWRRYPSEQIALIATTPAEPIPGTLSISAQGNVLEARRYGYDDTGRLVSEAGTPDAAQHFTYDALGNRLSDDAANDYQYDDANRLLSGNGVTYTYDLNGNRKAKTEAGATTNYHYSSQNQLTGIDFPAGHPYRSARYAYDPLGRRIEKVLTRDSGAVTVRRYVYDGANLIAELDGEDHLLTEFLHGPGIDQPLAMMRAGRTYTYQADALGSILAIIDDTSAVVQRYRYDAWGNILEVQDPNFKQPFAYTGREWDEESGLYYYRARYYDASVGRFVQSDPIGLRGGVNTYAYVHANPANRGVSDFLCVRRSETFPRRRRRPLYGRRRAARWESRCSF